MSRLKEMPTPKRKAMVTIGTDGVVDYVQVPEGQRFTLGPVSVLRLITGLVPSKSTARKALDEFLAKKQVMVPVDLDQMWALLPYKRSRYSSTNHSMGSADQSAVLENQMIKSASYESFAENVEMAEDIVAKLASTNETIDRLVARGRKFNASRAKGDLMKIATRVEEITQNVDLAQPWVGSDLAELSKKATEIHALFPTE
jgi:hypothetical protein